MIDLSVIFIYILCSFWWLAWCATLYFVNGSRPRVAANDMVVIVCQCDNVWFPISMWSWTFDEGGILSGRQSAVICHQLNELLTRHPLSFQWQYHIHGSPFGPLPWFPHYPVHGIKEMNLACSGFLRHTKHRNPDEGRDVLKSPDFDAKVRHCKTEIWTKSTMRNMVSLS